MPSRHLPEPKKNGGFGSVIFQAAEPTSKGDGFGEPEFVDCIHLDTFMRDVLRDKDLSKNVITFIDVPRHFRPISPASRFTCLPFRCCVPPRQRDQNPFTYRLGRRRSWRFTQVGACITMSYASLGDGLKGQP
jgi:hypothetical protein